MGGMMVIRGKTKELEVKPPVSLLPPQIHPRPNPGLRNNKPARKHLGYGVKSGKFSHFLSLLHHESCIETNLIIN
jgi:hypothetical protein